MGRKERPASAFVALDKAAQKGALHANNASPAQISHRESTAEGKERQLGIVAQDGRIYETMLRMRLRRVGARNQPSYRIVVADSRAARDGAFVDYLGHYNPRTEPPTVVIDEKKARKWLSVGAQPSEAVQRIIDKMGELQESPADDGTSETDDSTADQTASEAEAGEDTETSTTE